MLIELARIEGILRNLTTIAVPLLPANHGGGLDGVSFELEVDLWSENVRISWWMWLPDEWKPLEPIVSALENAFEEAWETGAPSVTAAGDSGNNRS